MLARLTKSISGTGDPSIVARVQAARLTFLLEENLRDLYETVLRVDHAGLPDRSLRPVALLEVQPS